ncbi:MAG: (d)CMP kinase [candidate division Zixibacteria bacterium]|nr:(d)CMP kinase [candidate division Zixibacteria bacterium]
MNQVKFKLSRLEGKIIAIDGPAGAGKSTTARILADRLGFMYLDTGAMYRALTWFAMESGILPGDGEKLAALAREVPLVFNLEGIINRVLINGIDVTEEIRSSEVTTHVSEVSAHKEVRKAMVKKQRQLAGEGSVVAEGRDTTTVVFPKADIKIYLDASIRQRAERRLLELVRKGVSTTIEEQEADILRRDKYDSQRTHSPLTKASNAFVIDTSEMTIEGQIDHILALILSVVR